MKTLILLLLTVIPTFGQNVKGWSYTDGTKVLIQTNLMGTMQTLTVSNQFKVGLGASTFTMVIDASGGATYASVAGVAENYKLDLYGTANTATITSTSGLNTWNFSGIGLQESGNAVPNATDNLGFFAATTSAQFYGVISDESGAAGVVPRFSLTGVAQGHVIYYNGTSWVNLAPGSADQVLTTHGAGANPTWEDGGGSGTATNVPVTIGFTVDGAGTAITAGIKGYWIVEDAFTISGYGMMTDQSGTVVVDIWMEPDPFDGSGIVDNPPTVAETIIGGGGATKPTLTAQRGKRSTVLTDWDVTIPAGSMIGWNIDASPATITRFTFQLFGTLD